MFLLPVEVVESEDNAEQALSSPPLKNVMCLLLLLQGCLCKMTNVCTRMYEIIFVTSQLESNHAPICNILKIYVEP